MKLKKRSRFLICTLLMVTLLSACGRQEEVKTTEAAAEIREKEYIGETARNTIRLSPDGNVLEISVEDYTSVIYDEEDLKKFIQSEIDSYNEKLGVNKISFREMKLEGNVVKLAISYSDLETYAAFNRMSVKLSKYDPSTADRIAAEEAAKNKVEERKTEEVVISDAELAEAGYSPEELEQQKTEEEEASEAPVKAVFTGPSGNTVGADDIPSGENLMLVTDERIAVELENGQIQYVNTHATFQDGAALTEGEGTAVIVLFLGI